MKSNKTMTPKNTTVPPIKTRDVSSSGSVGSRIVTVMCCRSKCVGNPNVVGIVVHVLNPMHTPVPKAGISFTDS